MKAIIKSGDNLKESDNLERQVIYNKTNKCAKIPYTIDCTSESFCQVWQ